MAPLASISNSTSLEKKPVSWNNLALGAALNLFEVSSLGQPFEVLKTQMAANRSQSIGTAFRSVWQRGGVRGFYQGLIPWAWIEASTKGAVLLFTASEAEYYARAAGASPFLAGIFGGMAGGIAQAYSTMGFCTFMKTVEVTRHKSGAHVSTFRIAADIYKKEGFMGINKGVNAVAVRQCTNWASRFGITRFTQDYIIKSRYGDSPDAHLQATALDKALASIVGGSLSCWNQPIEVIRIEMQSQVERPGRPKNLTIVTAFKYIYAEHGAKGLFKGVVPRIGLGVWQTMCMVALGDYFKEFFGTK
ncbi:mitochondrial carrier domain-containing protein [Spinellus fusiger]|nr:mitochondrial carrier domain-containing protein [Spinellus fusiger]